MKTQIKAQVINLRKSGFSISELSNKFGVSKSTVSTWVKNIPLSIKAKARIDSLYTAGQVKSQEIIRQKTLNKIAEADLFAISLLKGINITQNHSVLIAVMLWWCEGNKDISSSVSFTNSDPDLVKTYISLLRKGFDLDEQKFRILMHLHDYHVELKERRFWSEITGIAQDKFYKSHLKLSNHAFKKDGYHGCIKIQYNDRKLARNMHSIAKRFMERYK